MTFKELLGGASLRVIIDPEPGEGAHNMAIDDWLLDHSSDPVLRIYRWKRPTLSLGFSQKTDWINWESVSEEGVDVVRRPTGGRALLHYRELTYSVVLPNAIGSVAEFYEAITGWLAEGLRRLGHPVEAASHSVSSKGAPGCYSLIQRGELLLDGKKVIGSAQARRGQRLLQHGAIPLFPDTRLLARLIPGQEPYAGLNQQLSGEDLSSALCCGLPTLRTELPSKGELGFI